MSKGILNLVMFVILLTNQLLNKLAKKSPKDFTPIEG